MADSSAESGLYAPSMGHKVGRNFRLMVRETLADDILLNLRRLGVTMRPQSRCWITQVGGQDI